MDYLANDGGPGAISGFPRLAPRWGPTVEDCVVERFPAGMGWLRNLNFWVTSENPGGPLGWLLGDHVVTMGAEMNPCRAM